MTRSKHSTTDSLPTTTILLEEQVCVEERTLQSMMERASQLARHLEVEGKRQEELQASMVRLEERKASLLSAKQQHEALLEELQDSLTKSRDKWQRLLAVQEVEDAAAELCHDSSHEDDDDDDDDEQERDPMEEAEPLELLDPSQQKDVDSSTALVPLRESSGCLKQSNSADDATTSGRDSSRTEGFPLADLKTLEYIRRYLSDHAMPSGLLTCSMPGITPREVEQVLLLAIREANARDLGLVATMSGGGTLNKYHHRRCSLWGTTLDFALFGDREQHGGNGLHEEDEDESEMERSMIHDLTMCPYELAGTCADDMCPYMHTTKDTLAREQLLLPQLKLNAAIRNNVVKPAAIEDEHTRDVDPRFAGSFGSEDTTDELEFVTLPHDSDGADGGQVENFVNVAGYSSIPRDSARTSPRDDDSTSPSAQSFTLWHGTVLESSMISISQILNSFEVIEVKEGMVTLKEPIEQSIQDEGLGDILQCGRLVDLCRVLESAGRFDILIPFSKLTARKSMTRHQFWPVFTKCLTVHARGGYGQSKNYAAALHPTVFHRSFTSQLSLAILSESARWLHFSDSSDFWATALECAKLVVSPIESATRRESNEDNLFQNEPWKQVFLGALVSIPSSPRKQKKTTKAMTYFSDLLRILQWLSGRFLGPLSWFTADQAEDVLTACWEAISEFFRSVLPEEFEASSLKAISLAGYTILGCLKKCADEIPYGSDHLNLGHALSLAGVDSVVHRMLESLVSSCSSHPMSRLMLASLYAASCATATFLRQYSGAQHRLEKLLTLGPSGESHFLFQCSELLWSQFVQLRMTLPLEVLRSDHDSDETKHCSDWFAEPSDAAKRDLKLISSKMDDLGIRLHNIGVPGDQDMIMAVLENGKKKASLEYQILVSRLASLNKNPSRIAVENSPLLVEQSNIRGRVAAHHLYTLPISCLITGKELIHLSIVRSGLSYLPVSFGLCFPNLKSLDLGDNTLTKLPDSFRRLTELRELQLRGNNFESIPEGILVRSLEVLSLGQNNLVSFPSLSLASRCPQLKELDISRNYLNVKELDAPGWTLRISSLTCVKFKPQLSPPTRLTAKRNPGSRANLDESTRKRRKLVPVDSNLVDLVKDE